VAPATLLQRRLDELLSSQEKLTLALASGELTLGVRRALCARLMQADIQIQTLRALIARLN
jgi:hypothetical protein